MTRLLLDPELRRLMVQRGGRKILRNDAECCRCKGKEGPCDCPDAMVGGIGHTYPTIPQWYARYPLWIGRTAPCCCPLPMCVEYEVEINHSHEWVDRGAGFGVEYRRCTWSMRSERPWLFGPWTECLQPRNQNVASPLAPAYQFHETGRVDWETNRGDNFCGDAWGVHHEGGYDFRLRAPGDRPLAFAPINCAWGTLEWDRGGPYPLHLDGSQDGPPGLPDRCDSSINAAVLNFGRYFGRASMPSPFYDGQEAPYCGGSRYIPLAPMLNVAAPFGPGLTAVRDGEVFDDDRNPVRRCRWSVDYAQLGCRRGDVRLSASVTYDAGGMGVVTASSETSMRIRYRSGRCRGVVPDVIDAGPSAPGIVLNAQGRPIREDGGMGCGGCDAM